MIYDSRNKEDIDQATAVMIDNAPPSLLDQQVVQCNYFVGTSVCAIGTRAYLTYHVDAASGRVQIVARSRSCRWVTRWESLKRLHNFRLKTLCPEDPLYAEKYSIARDHWTQTMVDNLNHLAVKAGDVPEQSPIC